MQPAAETTIPTAGVKLGEPAGIASPGRLLAGRVVSMQASELRGACSLLLTLQVTPDMSARANRPLIGRPEVN